MTEVVPDAELGQRMLFKAGVAALCALAALLQQPIKEPAVDCRCGKRFTGPSEEDSNTISNLLKLINFNIRNRERAPKKAPNQRSLVRGITSH